MPTTILAAAQSASVPQDVRANVATHLAFARAAAERSVSLLLFPELSLTGYELTSLATCLVGPEDEELVPLRDFSQKAHMTLIVGAPVASESGEKPSIGAICIQPDGSSALYRKRFLHAGEQAFAAPGSIDAHSINLNRERVSLAICADTVSQDHPRWAREAGATVYAAGVLWSDGGYDTDAALMKAHCALNGFAALVANHASPTGGYQSAGRSAFWAGGGRLLCTAPSIGQALLVVQRQDSDWACACHKLDA